MTSILALNFEKSVGHGISSLDKMHFMDSMESMDSIETVDCRAPCRLQKRKVSYDLYEPFLYYPVKANLLYGNYYTSISKTRIAATVK